MKKQKKKITKKVKKVAVKRRIPADERIYNKLSELCPPARKAEGDRLKSWVLLAQKLALAKKMKTSVFCITSNPDILEYRDLIKKHFPCDIYDPTEARFGMDSIQKF